jgi:lysophospholipase L1-like esterase
MKKKTPRTTPPMRTRNISIRIAAGAALLAAGAGCASDPNYGNMMPDAGSGTDTGTPTNNPVPPPAPVVAAGVRWVGRVDTTSNPAQPRFAWSGTGFVARFDGTSLTAQLSISGTSQIFKPVVDGAPQTVFTAPAGQAMYMLATGLAAGVHTVELYRQTEGPQGETRLTGLTVGDGALMDPPAGPDRLIEVIGDSITCGYGNLGTLSDSDCYPTESHWDTYEAIAARALGAEVSTIAASGRGIIRNYGGDTSGTMPMLYDRTLTNVASPSWDFHVEPQAVIINLGTNDISNGKGDPGDPFRDTYITLLQTIRNEYPHTYIVCIIAPLLNGGDLSTISGHIRDAVAARNAAGDSNVEFFSSIPAQTSDKYACQYHPNVAENMMMADLLVTELKSKLGW